MSTTGETQAALDTLPLEDIRTMVRAEGARIKELGDWAEWMDPDKSLTDRIPQDDDESYPGFDAGIACALNLIPSDKQKLSAIMHAGIKPEAIEQIRSEITEMDPDSETVWWLAGCNVCEEGTVDASKFRAQVEAFQELTADPKKRVEAARDELDKMMSTFETSTYGVPYGTVDGCMHGAYIAGHPLATTYDPNHGIFFIGTFDQPLDTHLQDYPWKNPDQGKERGTSGVINPNFIKCADEEEFRAVLAHLEQHVQQVPVPTVADDAAERADVHEDVQDGVDAVTGGVEGEFYYGSGGGGLLKVDLAPSVDQVTVEAADYLKKAETHMTLVPGRMKLDRITKTGVVDKQKIVDLLQGPMELDADAVATLLEKGPSNKQCKAAVKLALPAAAEGLSFQVKPRDEYRIAEKGESRTIIQMCDVEGADQYYRKLEELLGLPEGHITPPPHHVTLFTGENGKAIGIGSEKELDQLTRPVSADVIKASL